MRTAVLFIILLGLPAAAFAQPSIVFDTETHDFGTVKGGDSYKHVFTFVNTGTEELVILKLDAA